jgi:hypothetical protein
MASSLGAAAAGPDSTATLGTSAGEARTPARLVTTGLEFLNPGTLLLWTRGDDRPVVGVLDIDSGIFQPLGLDLSAPLKQVGVFPRGIVIVDESGTCLILDLFSFRPRFRYRSPGMNKLVFAVGDTLVGGRASLSTFGSPLLQINERTGETVAISDPGLFVYDLAFEPREASLYTLSVDNRSTPGRTILKAHSGYGFERSRILSEYRGEDLGASLAKDAAGRIYSSLGYERVLVWDGQDVDKLEDARKIHRGLFTTGEKVVAVNRDGSLSFWETRRGQLLLTLYVLQDLGWLAVLPDGSTYTPPD